jgi:hypothetical protein
MGVVVGLLVLVALMTLVKLATRRLFRRPGHAESRPEPKPAVEAPARPGKPAPTSRTNAKRQRRR